MIAVTGHALLMLPLSASIDLQSSALVRLCAQVHSKFALMMTAVTNIAITPASVVTLVTHPEPMHQLPFAVAVALMVFAVSHEHVMTTLVLQTLLKIQESHAAQVAAVTQCVAPRLVLLLSAPGVTQWQIHPRFVLEAFAVLPCAAP